MSVTPTDNVSNVPHTEKYQFLYEVSRDISKLNESTEVLQCLVRYSQQYFESDAASIVWLEADGTQLFRAVEGLHAEKVLGLRLPKSEGISGWVAEHGDYVWIPDVSVDKRFFVGVDESTGFKTRSILAAPLLVQNQIAAVMEVVNPSICIDDEQVKSLLAALMTLTTDALERCDLSKEAYRYQKVFETFAEPCLLLSKKGDLLGVNRAAGSIFHIDADLWKEKHFDDLGVSAVSFKNLLGQMQNKDGLSWDFVLNEATPRTYKTNFAPVRVGDSLIYHWCAYDITEYSTLEDSRLQLFNMLVHDLRVPLGSIHHSIELVMTAWYEQDVTIPVDQVLEIALRSEHRMERLISDILDTTRLNSQTKALEVTNIDITDLVQDAVNIVESSARRRNHLLDTAVKSTDETLQGDLDLLQRVLINILGNAVKYTPDGGEINVTVYDDEQNVFFEVSDNGPGILPADENHIFELFFRGNTSRVKGAGIGLAFSKLAVEAHGGKIWLDRELHEGAKFVFYIPKKLPESAIFFEE